MQLLWKKNTKNTDIKAEVVGVKKIRNIDIIETIRWGGISHDSSGIIVFVINNNPPLTPH